MADYTKSTNFTVKDSLASGDTNKKIRGSEIDTEFNNIATAVNSKANSASPTLTGTPLAPTAVDGTNTTQVATTAFVNASIVTERTTAGTLTNKTLTSPTINTPTISGGTMTTTTGTLNGVTLGSNGSGAKTISTSAPSGGSDGDVWYKVT